MDIHDLELHGQPLAYIREHPRESRVYVRRSEIPLIVFPDPSSTDTRWMDSLLMLDDSGALRVSSVEGVGDKIESLRRDPSGDSTARDAFAAYDARQAEWMLLLADRIGRVTMAKSGVRGLMATRSPARGGARFLGAGLSYLEWAIELESEDPGLGGVSYKSGVWFSSWQQLESVVSGTFGLPDVNPMKLSVQWIDEVSDELGQRWGDFWD